MSQQEQLPRIVSRKTLPSDQAKWVTLKKIEWKNQDNQDKIWEVAERTTRKGEIDAVAIVALLESKNSEFKPSTIIIEQYRPPVEKFVIEMPAGLIDEGETPEAAAIRELEEETGYKVDQVIESSPLLVSDPGMTNANMKLVVVKVLLDDYPSSPKQQLDDGEHIVRRVVELDSLMDELRAYEKRGFVIDARLSHFASGWELANKFGKAAKSS
ncbi:hypothetical protein M407DRAFT_244997 [Tulasnella calospora MUT 4182]|uniref:Nudix hydrolase domain-containing protein n=1 Tax=Tulasnella calospora MUT 4182 TaxID=1051891 RepID=A0A0C3QC76_9AGAM|nr:hypothetical protein M407DRAFT_244997 [Tulasnella calospora MUT 4182]